MLSLIRKFAGRALARKTRALASEFLAQTKKADEVQRDRLLETLRRNASGQFGRDHGFSEIRTATDFRRRVPIRGYDGHEPYIARVREGNIGALFGPDTEVLMFAMTSGTTATPKTIPVTRESLRNYRQGWSIWGIRAFDDHPAMLANGLKPILQLVSNWREQFTPGGIPCGAITGLTAHMQNRLVRTTYCMPPVTMAIKDIESKYYLALRLSAYRDLGATMAANPSTILGIAKLGDREKETLIRDLRDGTLDPKWNIPIEVRTALAWKLRKKHKPTALRLEEIASRTGRLLPKDYWPSLDFLANWTGGTMGSYLRHYPEFFGDRPVRDIGLIASEGRFTIPIEDGTAAGILDIRHHYYEFLPEDQIDREEPETVEAADLIEGRRYYILPTTAGGLYRYQIFDLVCCRGFHGRAPLIEFLNKGAHISSLTGEKVSEFQVVSAVDGATKALNLKLKSYLLAATWADPPYYSLLVEDDEFADGFAAETLASHVESRLTEGNVEYENKRSTQRLGPIRVVKVAAGSWADFQKRRLAKSGGTVEQYKQPCLMSDVKAIEEFRISG